MPPDLDALLAQLEAGTALQAMECLYQARYSGPITFHLHNGRPKAVEVTETYRRQLRVPGLTGDEEIAQTSKR